MKTDKKPFIAKSWLQGQRPMASGPSREGARPMGELLEDLFRPNNHLIPQWKGDSLISGKALKTKKILNNLWADALKQFVNVQNPNKTLKTLIYDEFISYAHSVEFNCDEILNVQNFWEELSNENSQHHEILHSFTKIYSFRVVLIYLFKSRFIIELNKNIGTKTTQKDLFNPSATLAGIFRSHSSTELNCASLKHNQYSWYRPAPEQLATLGDLLEVFSSVTISEMMKIFTYNPKANSSGLEFEDQHYSHSLSHRSFGLLLTHLMINFPKWQNGERLNFNESINSKGRLPKVLNCKFEGDYLGSLVLSHWLAQEKNLNMRWHEIISPDFVSDDFSYGPFTKFCQELQFLATMVKIADYQQLAPISLICNVMREKYNNSQRQQMALFPSDTLNNDITYDRIVLNLCDMPKHNPHHQLLTKINNQIGALSPSGHIFVLTNQKLFVPSHSGKIKQLLSKVKVEAYFDLDDLDGKGKIPSYMYILSPRKNNDHRNHFHAANEKESCHAFKWSGELAIFQRFQLLVDSFHQFMEEKDSNLTPFHQDELSTNLSFQFHQDAILDGKLLHAASNDTSRITHPRFFKSLTNTCLPLEQFFRVEALNLDNHFEGDKFSHSSFLGIDIKQQKKYSCILIVDYRDPLNIGVELTNLESYKAKVEEYGLAFYQYFGLSEKVLGINLNVLREYWKSDIGKQIIQLTLSGSSKIKSKVRALLIPRFIGMTKNTSDQLSSTFKVLEFSKDKILDTHPSELTELFENQIPFLERNASENPASVCGALSYFKNNLIEALHDIERNQVSSSSDLFQHPMIKQPLLALNTTAIYPNNSDVFTEFHNEHLDRPMVRFECSVNNESHQITLYSDAGKTVTFHSSKYMIQFLGLIFERTINMPIGTIIQGVRVPNEKELSHIIEKFDVLKNQIKSISEKSQGLLNNIFLKSISKDI